MLILLDDLKKKYDIVINGVLHIGAHECEELDAYKRCGVDISKIIWIDAIPEIVNKCKKQIEGVKIYNYIVSDSDGTDVKFHVTNNYQSSSILELEDHKIHHPYIHEIYSFNGKTTTVKTIYKELSLENNFANFANLDIQGAELLALKGFGDDILKNIDYIYTEVNTAKLYKDCCLLNEMDAFLKENGFRRADTKILDVVNWGDALYIRDKTMEKKEAEEKTITL